MWRLQQVPRGTTQAALVLGLSPMQTLRLAQLPLVLPVIVAGAKTATVMTVGTATIAAFIGAGGYGERIAQELALNDGMTLLAGAIPAAGFALVVQGMFEVVENLLRRRRGTMSKTTRPCPADDAVPVRSNGLARAVTREAPRRIPSSTSSVGEILETHRRNPERSGWLCP